MQIIPVIDLKDGQVVHAKGGDRRHYQPIHHTSRICHSSELDHVVASFLKLYPFERFYIADLNAIGGTGNHHHAISGLLNQYPAQEFWVDSGERLESIDQARFSPRHKAVIGTESQTRLAPMSRDKLILSLDYKQQRLLGVAGWLESPRLWPDTVIVMTLDFVGSNQGPHTELMAKLCAEHPNKRFVAAGGVRNIGDLLKLQAIGVHLALVASALHHGAISAAELGKF